LNPTGPDAISENAERSAPSDPTSPPLDSSANRPTRGDADDCSDDSSARFDVDRAHALASSIVTLLRAQLGPQALPLASELASMLDAARGESARVVDLASRRAR
jgi:hypothetical protein